MPDAPNIAALGIPPALCRRYGARSTRPPTACSAGPLDDDRDLPGAAVPSRWRMPLKGQEPVLRQDRTVSGRAGAPADAGTARDRPVLHDLPTIHLQRLARCQHQRHYWRHAGARAATVDQLPRAGPAGRQGARYMEGDAPSANWPWCALTARSPTRWTGRASGPCRCSRTCSASPPQPGRDDRPGTNSYLVGEPGTGFIAIDPARPTPTTWKAVARGGRRYPHDRVHPLAPRPFPWCSPAASDVRTRGRAMPPILGLPSAPTARVVSQFTPDRALQIMSCWRFLVKRWRAKSPIPPASGAHPGHAANHLCLILREDGLLFSGDHILNGSTTVIDPPDGNMADYLDFALTGSMPCAPNTTCNSSCPHTAMCWTMRGRHRPAQGPPPGARRRSAGRHASPA